jgi:hypothetical protein
MTVYRPRLGNETVRLIKVRKLAQKLAQKLGQLQPFIAVFSTGMHGPTRIVWANLTPFSLKRHAALHASSPLYVYLAWNVVHAPDEAPAWAVAVGLGRIVAL